MSKIDAIMATIESLISSEKNCTHKDDCIHCTFKEGKLNYIRHLMKGV